MKAVQMLFCRLILPVVILSIFTIGISAQDLNPIRWSIKTENRAVKAGDTFKIQVIAAIDEGWHLYSLEQHEGGPIPTRISVPADQKFKLSGDIETPQPQVLFDKNFNMDTQFYDTEAVFILPVEIAKDAATGKNTLTVSAFYQTCNDKMCLPPKLVKFTTDVNMTGGNPTAANTVKTPNAPTATQQPLAAKNTDAKAVEFDFVDFAGKSRKLSEFRGKFVLLDFWATWCKPCLADIPKLKKLYDTYKASGFEIIGMDSETIGDEEGEQPDLEFAKETAARARQIVATRAMNWTQATNETSVPVAKKIFNVKALPTKILLDKEGKIIATIGEKDDLTAIVEKLIKGNN